MENRTISFFHNFFLLLFLKEKSFDIHVENKTRINFFYVFEENQTKIFWLLSDDKLFFIFYVVEMFDVFFILN